MTPPRAPWSDTLIDRMQYQADPLADATITRILDAPGATVNTAARLADAADPQWVRLAAVSRLFEQWQDNRSVTDWRPAPGLPPEIAEPIAEYLAAAHALPDWCDRTKLRRAEALFVDHGLLSVALLFCASLPECYVVPDLAEVLQTTGQLEQHTEHRVRATAAMIFPVMMSGGLTDPQGGGIAQVLKVRLIHATIRHLILRKSPAQAMAALRDANLHDTNAGVVPPIALSSLAQTPRGMHQALYARGWKLGADGLPCSQEELAYTLLTFHYVFLRGLRTLGVGLPRADEEAFLHAWNVMGHVLGIEREMMVDTMDEAKALFARMQARGRASPLTPDPRPELGRALMRTMEQAIPVRVAKPFPSLLTRHLCGRATARDIGVARRVSLVSLAVFMLLLGLARVVDTVARLFVPGFSIARFATRVIGRRFMMQVLMDQTRPLKLPGHVLSRADAMMAGWTHDPQAPRWLNALEARFASADGAAAR